MTFGKIEAGISIAVIFLVIWRNRLKIEDALLFFPASLFAGFLVWGQFGFLHLPGLSHMDMLPIFLLFGAGFCYVIFISKKAKPTLHQGGVFLTSLTFLYLLTFIGEPWRWVLLVLFMPLFAFQIYEAVSQKQLSENVRFILSLQYSLCAGMICLYQVSFFDDLIAMSFNAKLGVNFFIQSFLIQLTIFWAFFYFSHFLHATPFFKTGSYKSYMKNMIIPEYAAQLDQASLSKRNLFLAFMAHGGVILLNLATHFVPPQIMFSYLVLLSPKVIQVLVKAQASGG